MHGCLAGKVALATSGAGRNSDAGPTELAFKGCL